MHILVGVVEVVVISFSNRYTEHISKLEKNIPYYLLLVVRAELGTSCWQPAKEENTFAKIPLKYGSNSQYVRISTDSGFETLLLEWFSFDPSMDM